ncbi:MAG: DUF1796 family putative cysteine peptidase [Alphaproteobacteria bacterium]|nr:DUF1796 family putative cysteine peptidase [Alphaproteobacteria bacterium]
MSLKRTIINIICIFIPIPSLSKKLKKRLLTLSFKRLFAKKTAYDFIFPMGEACFVAMFLRDLNLRIASGPFDWCFGSTFEQRFNLFINKFKRFFDKKDLTHIDIDKKANKDVYQNTYTNKLHTKRDINSRPFLVNGFDVGGGKWRNYLLNFCKTEENWKKSLNLLNRDDVTMVSDYHVILKQDDNVDTKYLDELEKKLKISYSKEREFVAGTMFVAKANIFKPLQNKLKSEEFSSSVRNTGDDLPYACERIFGFVNDGKIVSFDGKKGILEKYLTLILSFVYKHKITDKKESIKILGVPVYKKNKKKEEM